MLTLFLLVKFLVHIDDALGIAAENSSDHLLIVRTRFVC